MATFNSNEIRLLRLARQMKQEEVARRMKIKKQRYSQLENHKNLRKEREDQILSALGYTIETAKKYLSSIPPPSVIKPIATAYDQSLCKKNFFIQ